MSHKIQYFAYIQTTRYSNNLNCTYNTIQFIKLSPVQTQFNIKKYHNTTLLQYVLMWCIWGKLYFSHFCNLYEVNIQIKSKFHSVKFVGLLILRTILSQNSQFWGDFRGNWTQKWLISDHCTICTTIPMVIYSLKQIKIGSVFVYINQLKLINKL